MSPTRISLIQGCGLFGTPSRNLDDVATCQALVDFFFNKGHAELDTARLYVGGEQMLAKLDTRNALVDTKAGPMGPSAFAPANLRAQFEESRKALGGKSINIFYLHAPDHTTPIAETLKEVDALYKGGNFKELGLSNYYAWEVAEIVTVTRANGWIQPTVYQGVYNAIERTVEDELIPCLRNFGIKFYAYSPLANGTLALDIDTVEGLQARGNRFNSKTTPWAGYLTGKYAPLLPIITQLRGALAKHNIKLRTAALRWLQHHSALQPGDGICIGAATIEQLATSLEDSEGGPLPKDVVAVFEQAWTGAKGYANYYAQITPKEKK